MKTADSTKPVGNASVYYNRLAALADRQPDTKSGAKNAEILRSAAEELRELDPNRSAPLTTAEQQASPVELLERMHAILAEVEAATKGVITRRHVQHLERGGRTVQNTADFNLGLGDERVHTDISSTVSTHNIVEPLYPKSMQPTDNDSYDVRLGKLIDEASEYIFVEAYEFQRLDLVDKLIEKAKQGIQVTVLVQSPRKRSDDTRDSGRDGLTMRCLIKFEKAMRDPALKKLGTLRVTEYVPVQHDSNKDTDGIAQILHVKKMIADRPDGTIAEVGGGINFGLNSLNNYDTGWYTEGVAALDSLERLLLHYPLAELKGLDLSVVPSTAAVAKLMRGKAKKKGLTTVEIASAGQIRPDKAIKYSLKELKSRAEKGQKISIGADQLFDLQLIREAVEAAEQNATQSDSGATVAANPKVLLPPGTEDERLLDLIEQAVLNGSWVQIVIPAGCEGEKETIKAIRKQARKLSQLGAEVIVPGQIRRDSSYQSLVYRELDVAIENKESISVAAFCLTDPGIIDRLLQADAAGCDVEVIIDDLTIGPRRINKSSMTRLTNAGIPVRVFDSATAEALAPKGIPASKLKLHAKVMVLGGNRVLGGSCNFTPNGFLNNVEDGRLVHSEEVAKGYINNLFAPLRKHCQAVKPFATIAASQLVNILDHVDIDTPIEDIVFIGDDLETTGFAAHCDDRITQSASVAARINPKKGTVEALDSFVEYIDPGHDQLGDPIEIPTQVVEITGFDRQMLIDLGAEPMTKVYADWLGWVKGLQKDHTNLVLAGQNYKFDMRFRNQVMRREGLPMADGTHGKLDVPYVDLLSLDRQANPQERAHNLDAISLRLGVATEARTHHDGEEDVLLSLECIARLAKESGAKTLRDLLPKDRLYWGTPVLARASSSKRSPKSLRLQEYGDNLMIHKKEADGSWGQALHVRDIVKLEAAAESVAVTLEVSLGEAGKWEEQTIYIAAKDVRFSEGGAVYWDLKEKGLALPQPHSVDPDSKADFLTMAR